MQSFLFPLFSARMTIWLICEVEGEIKQLNAQEMQ